MCGGVVRPVAVVPLWQLEQLVSVAAWAKRAAGPAGEAADSRLAWQVTQSGRWSRRGPDTTPCPCAPLVPSPVYEPLWQESQRLALTAAWFIV